MNNIIGFVVVFYDIIEFIGIDGILKQSILNRNQLENDKNNSHFLLFGLNPSRKRGISVALLFSTNLGSSFNEGFSRR